MPVTIRFSNGSGSPVEHDDALDVRGMAAKFHLASGAEADLIMITLPVFFAKDPDEFLGFARAGTPAFDPLPGLWQRIMDMLRLRPDPTRPDPKNPDDGSAGVLRYANRHASARPGTVAALLLVTPTSYAPRDLPRAAHLQDDRPRTAWCASCGSAGSRSPACGRVDPAARCRRTTCALSCPSA